MLSFLFEHMNQAIFLKPIQYNLAVLETGVLFILTSVLMLHTTKAA